MAEKKFSLADAMRDTIGSASVANMASGEHFVDVNNMGDDEITERVLQLKVDAGNAILEIGRWLTVMKERKEHGEWLAWLEQVDIHERAAQRYIRLYQGYSTNPTALSDLGPTKALTLLALPPKEREEFMQEHDIVDMTSRQLDEAIKRQAELEQERDEARAALDTALADVKKAEEYAAGLQADMSTMEVERDAAKARVKELETHKDVYQDEEAIKNAADEARAAAQAEMQKKVDTLKSKLKKAEEKAELAGAESNAEATKAKAEADRLRAELESAKKAAADAAVGSDADFTQCLTLAEQIKSFANTINGIKLKALNQGDEIKAEKLKKLILRIADDVRGCA